MVLSDDDSDASFQASKKTNKRPSPKAYQVDDDDSDSDDSLLAGTKPTFRTSKRLRENQKPKMDSHLEDALKSRSMKMETKIATHRKIQKAQQEMSTNYKEDELLESAKKLQVQRDEERKEREKEKAHQREQELQLLQQQATPMDGSSPPPRRRHDWWLEVRDTELTQAAASNFGISLQNRNLPDSMQTATEYLEFVLKGNKTKVAKTLLLHLKEGTLPEFLLHKGLLRLSARDLKSLPNALLQWMLEVAVATCNAQDENDVEFDKLSSGAYETLVELWLDGKGTPKEGSLLAITDLPVQLERWFGIDLSEPVSDKTNPKSPTSVAALETTTTPCKKIPAYLQSISIIRCLHLWQLALEHDELVFWEKQDVSDGVLALLLVSLDPFVWESTETLASHNPSAKLQNVLSKLFQIQTTTATTEHNHANWTSKLATRIRVHLASGGSKNPSLQQEDTMWSDYARVVRVLCHTPGSSELVAHLCERLVAQVKIDDSAASNLNWGDQTQLSTLKGWSAFSIISLLTFQLIDKLPNQGVETLVPAALVELLLEALIMALSRLEIGVRGLETNLDTASKYAFCHLMDTVLVELVTKSKALTAKNPNYLKVNYHASCFRQYTRLETQKYKTTEQQSTLDGFFTKFK